MLVRRGEVRLTDLEPVRGSEADKRRPAVVVSELLRLPLGERRLLDGVGVVWRSESFNSTARRSGCLATRR